MTETSSTAQAVMDLLSAERKRSRTIQWMPADDRGPERFEVIVAATGDMEALYVVHEDGSLEDASTTTLATTLGAA